MKDPLTRLPFAILMAVIPMVTASHSSALVYIIACVGSPAWYIGIEWLYRDNAGIAGMG